MSRYRSTIIRVYSTWLTVWSRLAPNPVSSLRIFANCNKTMINPNAKGAKRHVFSLISSITGTSLTPVHGTPFQDPHMPPLRCRHSAQREPTTWLLLLYSPYCQSSILTPHATSCTSTYALDLTFHSITVLISLRFRHFSQATIMPARRNSSSKASDIDQLLYLSGCLQTQLIRRYWINNSSFKWNRIANHNWIELEGFSAGCNKKIVFCGIFPVFNAKYKSIHVNS